MSLKVNVTVKSSGGLQIGFWPLVIDYIFIFLFDPLNSSYSNSKVLNRSQVSLNEGKYIKICYKIRVNLKVIRTPVLSEIGTLVSEIYTIVSEKGTLVSYLKLLNSNKGRHT